MEMQNGTATLENSFAISYKYRYTLPYDVAVLVLFAREMKTCPEKKNMDIILDLFIFTKNRKQPKCPSIGEWISKL